MSIVHYYKTVFHYFIKWIHCEIHGIILLFYLNLRSLEYFHLDEIVNLKLYFRASDRNLHLLIFKNVFFQVSVPLHFSKIFINLIAEASQ